MAAGGNERTSGYFGDPTFGFIISGALHFRNPFLTKVTTLRRSRHPFEISRTFEITVSVFPPLF
jgi:hypothetical protein